MGEQRLRHRDQAKGHQRQHDQRPLQRPRHGGNGQKGPPKCRCDHLKTEIGHRRGQRGHRCPLCQRPGCRIGQPLRHQIGHPKNQDHAQSQSLRRLRCGYQPKTHRHDGIKDQCQHKRLRHRADAWNRDRTGPMHRGHRPDCPTGRKEGMRLVQRMGHDMQQRQRPQTHPALQQHEAHLRHRGPGQCRLDRTLRQHYRRPEQRGQAPQHHQCRHGTGAGLHQIRHADQQEPAAVDDARMEQRRDGGGRLHHLGQPAMQRERRGLERCHQHQQCHTDLRGQGQPRACKTAPCGLRQRENVRCAEGAPQQHGRQRQHRISGTPDKRELRRRPPRLGPLGVKQQQPPQRQTDGHKCQHQHSQTSGLHQRQDCGKRRQHQPVKCALPRLAVHIGPAIAHHHPADKSHQQRHRGTDRIKAKGDQPGPAAETDRARTKGDQLHHTRNRQRQHAKGRSLCQTGQRAGTATGLEQGKAGDSQKQDRREKDQGRKEGHIDLWWATGLFEIEAAIPKENYILSGETFCMVEEWHL